MRIAVIGAHPDDPEASCGGIAYKAIREGHKVDFLYATNGNKGGIAPAGISLAEAREQEACAAAAVCGATPHFMRYGDQELTFDPTSMQKMKGFLEEVNPDLILAHWPADLHQDHQAVGILVTQCAKDFPDAGLAYFEAVIGKQTFGMTANRFFDISDVVDFKKQMIDCHKTQSPENFWWRHEVMHKWYGSQCGVERAEAFMLHHSNRQVEEFFLLK